MSEGYYNCSTRSVEPWTTENILESADAEAGPSCCDESYQQLRAIMVVALDLLTALELIDVESYDPCSASGDWGSIGITLKDLNAIKSAIEKAKVRGEA